MDDLKTRIARFPDGEFFLTIGTWIGFFFLSLLGKNHQILHTHYCNTRQKRIPPKFMYRFSCSFAKENSPRRNLETPSRSHVGSKISSCHCNMVLKKSSICSLTL